MATLTNVPPAPRRWLRALPLLALAWLLAGCLLLSDKPEFYRCKSQQDCAADELCDLSGGTIGSCYPVGYCRFDSQCLDTEACVQERCTPVPCTPGFQGNDDVCQMYTCDSDYACRTSCTLYEHCQRFYDAPYRCEANLCVPAQCDYSLNCASGYQCIDGLCGTTCMYDNDCIYGYTCLNAACVPR